MKQIPLYRGLALTSLLFSLTACTLGPDYVRPETPLPTQWRQQGAGDATQPVASVAPVTALPVWREYFREPRLQALIEQAFEQNRDLRVAVARIAEARAQYGIQDAELYPNLEVGAKRKASLAPADVSGTPTPVHLQRYDVSLDLSYELDFWGRVRRMNEAVRANYLATEEAQRAFRLALMTDVANAWLSVQELQERKTLAQNLLKSREEARELTYQRQKVGISSEMDLLLAKGQYETARADLINLGQQLVVAENLLSLLLGQPLQASVLGAGNSQDVSNSGNGGPLSAVPAFPELPAGLPSAVLLQRPDVRAVEQRLIAANANIGVARAAFFPRISILGSLGTASRSLNGLFDSGSRAWMFEPSLHLPLFDAGRNAGNADLAEVRKEIAVAEYEKAIQQAFREVADLLSGRERLREQLSAQDQAAQLLRDRLRLAAARYHAGVSSYVEVLEAQRESILTRQAALQTRRAWLSNAAQLYKALGGENAPEAGETAVAAKMK